MIRIDKPWGHEEVLVEHPLYRLKRLVIRAGESTSYQVHAQKHETVYVEGGSLDVRLEDGLRRVAKGMTFDVPPGTKHQFIPTAGAGVSLLEVSNPVPDTDVVRIEDPYAGLRGGGG